MKLLSSDMQTVPLLKHMKHHEMRKLFKHYLLTETNNNDGKEIKRTYLVRKYFFKKTSVKKNPVQKCSRTRKVVIELVEIED